MPQSIRPAGSVLPVALGTGVPKLAGYVCVCMSKTGCAARAASTAVRIWWRSSRSRGMGVISFGKGVDIGSGFEGDGFEPRRQQVDDQHREDVNRGGDQEH